MKKTLLFVVTGSLCLFLSSCALRVDESGGVKPGDSKQINELAVWSGESIPFPEISKVTSPILGLGLVGDDNTNSSVKFESFEDKQVEVINYNKLLALRGASDFFRTNDGSRLVRKFSNSSVYILDSFTELDKALTVKSIKSARAKSLASNSGKFGFDGVLKLDGNFKVVSNLRYRVGLVSETEKIVLRESILSTGEFPVKVHPEAKSTDFSFVMSELDSLSVYKNFLLADSKPFVEIFDFDFYLDDSNKKTYKNEVSKSSANSAQIQIFTDNNVVNHFVKTSSDISLLSMLKKISSKPIEHDGQNLISFEDRESLISLNGDIEKLKDRYQGRWFILSNRRELSVKSVIHPSDFIVLIYAKGDDLYRSSRKIKRFSLENFSGELPLGVVPPINKTDKVSILVEGVRRKGAEPHRSHTTPRRFSNGCNGRWYGNVLKEVDEKISLSNNDTLNRFIIGANKDEALPITKSVFYKDKDLEDFNSSFYVADTAFNNSDDYSHLYINTGNFTGQFSEDLRIGSECFGDMNPNHFQRGGSGTKTFSQSFSYNIDIFVESFR